MKLTYSIQRAAAIMGVLALISDHVRCECGTVPILVVTPN
jgi:hypothetical protein